MLSASVLLASFAATLKALWVGGSPFAGFTALWPTSETHPGKYVIEAEGIRLAFTNRNGGAPTNLWINDTNGNEIDIILGLDNVEDYDDYVGKLGGVIGRVAGHISNAQFELNGNTYFTSANGNNGSTTWNGGENGWERMALDVASITPNSVTFVVFDRAGKNGFPGNGGSSLTHSVYPYEWRIAYGVTPSRTSGPVPINLSHKTFFNLDGFGPESETIEEHRLSLPFSGLRLVEDKNGVPTGDITGNLKGSEHDFWSTPRQMFRSLSQLDILNHLFLVMRPNPWDKDARPVASLSSRKSGITMDMYTDQEAIKVETWDDGPESPLHLKSGQGGRAVHKNAAISLQMMDWPDALSHPEWQRDHKILHGPDGLMTTFSKFKFTVAGRSKETA